MIDRLAGEIMDALNSAGGAVKKKDETHKMAKQIKAFSITNGKYIKLAKKMIKEFTLIYDKGGVQRGKQSVSTC